MTSYLLQVRPQSACGSSGRIFHKVQGHRRMWHCFLWCRSFPAYTTEIQLLRTLPAGIPSQAVQKDTQKQKKSYSLLELCKNWWQRTISSVLSFIYKYRETGSWTIYLVQINLYRNRLCIVLCIFPIARVRSMTPTRMQTDMISANRERARKLSVPSKLLSTICSKQLRSWSRGEAHFTRYFSSLGLELCEKRWDNWELGVKIRFGPPSPKKIFTPFTCRKVSSQLTAPEAAPRRHRYHT